MWDSNPIIIITEPTPDVEEALLEHWEDDDIAAAVLVANDVDRNIQLANINANPANIDANPANDHNNNDPPPNPAGMCTHCVVKINSNEIIDIVRVWIWIFLAAEIDDALVAQQLIGDVEHIIDLGDNSADIGGNGAANNPTGMYSTQCENKFTSTKILIASICFCFCSVAASK